MIRIRMLFLAIALLLPAYAGAGGAVDINAADAQTLAEAINGVGISRAQAIVAYRSEHGPFKSVDDLTAVKGIGDKLVEKNRDKLTVGGKNH